MMLTQEQINSFNTEGYLLIPNILNDEEVAFLRSQILSIFETGEWKKSTYNTAQEHLNYIYSRPESFYKWLKERKSNDELQKRVEEQSFKLC